MRQDHERLSEEITASALLRPIETKSFAAVAAPSSLGRPPRLEWIAISNLGVDPEYQREIGRCGHLNIRRIASGFDWSKFTPVIVAPVGGGKFAIVDGQHRTTAAAICGVEKVPCAVIEGARGEQAAAFRAINGNVTKLSQLQIFHAAVVAGEPDALHIKKVCDASGCSVARYPKAWNLIEPGETLAVGLLTRAVKRFGDDVAIGVLTAIRNSCDGNAGMLRAQIIFGACEVLADHKDWLQPQDALTEAFDEIDLGTMLEEAADRPRGTSTLNQFEARLVAVLQKWFAACAARDVRKLVTS